MYTYIYDLSLVDKKHTAAINKIESQLTDLGLAGRICRLSQLRSFRDTVSDELRRSPKTMVVVGGDTAVNRAVGQLAGTGVVFGVIPIGEDNLLAESLGISEGEAAAILSARRIINIDLGTVDNQAFLKSAMIGGENLSLTIDGSYSLRIKPEDKVEVVNYLLEKEECCLPTRPNPQSGSLTLMLNKTSSPLVGKKKIVEQTALHCRKISIAGENVTAVLDGVAEVKNPKEIKVWPRILDVIVGRSRDF